jgi:hypothetical protein
VDNNRGHFFYSNFWGVSNDLVGSLPKTIQALSMVERALEREFGKFQFLTTAFTSYQVSPTPLWALVSLTFRLIGGHVFFLK